MFAQSNAITRKLLRSVFVPLAGLVLFTTLGLAQTTAIEGDVKGDDGSPLIGALVKIDRTDIKGNYKVKTNKKGHYFHAGLPLGTYNVTIEVDGKDVDNVNNVRPRLGDPQVVDFDLQKIKKTNEARAKAADSGVVTPEVERGMTAEQKAKYEKAIKERGDQLKKNKALNESFISGREALLAKDYQTAVDKLKTAAEMDPKQHVIWGNMAEAYTGLADKAPAEEKAKLYDSAFDSYKKAIELAPADAAYHNNYGIQLAKAKKVDEAQTELKTAATLDPPNAGKYYYNLGAVLVNGGNYGAAEESFKGAIAADPNYADAYYQYGVTLMAKATTTPDGKFVPPPGPVEAFQKYLELKPDGQYAEGSKGMLQAIGGSVQTSFENPDRKKKAPPAKKK